MLILFSAIIILGCGQTEKKETTATDQLEEITAKTNLSEGFADVYLKIVKDTPKDSSHIYIASGLYNGKKVGLQFELKSNIPAGLTKDGGMGSGGFVSNPIKFSSIGEESNEFIKALSTLYGVPTKSAFSKEVTASTAFSLNAIPANLDQPGYYKFKLFFESNEGVPELFFNINTEERIIELKEKDNAYRAEIISTFTR
ncbi:MAG: hypothetical protein EOO91_06435 [Pedobacter sp.]|nr:MAG: hypothetical protein EOO91_06435 [Pedobacter sp.]